MFFISACEEKGASEKLRPESQSEKVGIFIYKKDDVYVSLVKEAALKAYGDKVEVRVHYAEGDQFLQKSQIDEELKNNVDVLVVNLVDTQSGAVVIDMIKKEDKPVLFFNREPDPSLIKNYDKACFIGTVPVDAGKMQGQLIKKLWTNHPEYDRNEDGKFQYVMFQGTPDNPEALARTEFSIREAVELGLKMEQVGETYVSDWDQEMAYRSMTLALKVHQGKIELVVANNDAMALGAIQALNEVGFNTGNMDDNFIPVVGVDATPQAIEAIKKGQMSATVKQDADKMGKAIVNLSLNALQGKNFLDDTDYEWDSTGTAVRIPYMPFSLEE